MISGSVVQILMCNPPQKVWKSGKEGTCIDFGIFWATMMSTEIFIDVAIMSLPIRLVVVFRLLSKKKFMVTWTPLLGIL